SLTLEGRDPGIEITTALGGQSRCGLKAEHAEQENRNSIVRKYHGAAPRGMSRRLPIGVVIRCDSAARHPAKRLSQPLTTSFLRRSTDSPVAARLTPPGITGRAVHTAQRTSRRKP